MDTIYSQRTGATPLASSQAIPSNPMVSAPGNRINMQALQDYLRANKINTPQAQVQPQGIDLQTLVNNAQQDNQAITRPDYDINPPPQAPQGGINIDQLLGQISSGGSLAGIDIGTPQPTDAGPEAFKTEQSMSDNGLLPTSAPKQISQNPTNDTKQYSQGAVNQGLQSVDIGMSSRNPNSAMSAESQNLDAQRIKGDMVNVAQARNPKAAWQELKKDPFYRDSNFYTGMMNVGLAIMSGANPYQAFQAGSKAMASADMKEQLKNNRDYLLQQYTPDSVAAAISSGDPTMLKQQQMSDQDRLQAEQDIWEQRNATSAAQEQSRAERDNAWQNQRQDKMIQNQEASSNRLLDRQKALLDYKANLAKGSADTDIYGGLTARQVSPITAQFRTAINQNASKMMQFNMGSRQIQVARDALNAGDYSKAAAAYREAQDNLARGTLGSQGMLDHERRDALTESPAFTTRNLNKANLQAGLGPTKSAIDFMEHQINIAQNAEHDELNKRMEDSVNRLVEIGMPEDKARALITSSVSLGFNTGSGPATPKKKGALNTDDSWMYK